MSSNNIHKLEHPKVKESDIRIVEGKGSKKAGGEPGGHYWHIYEGETRVGRVFINLNDEQRVEPYPSIIIEINKLQRGRGIGSIAYKLACLASQYDEVYATMRKGNIASRIAAERAGFKPVKDWRGTGIRLVWKRH